MRNLITQESDLILAALGVLVIVAGIVAAFMFPQFM